MKYNKENTAAKTLDIQAAKILYHFNQNDKAAFTLREAMDIFTDSSGKTVSKLLIDMVKRGLLLKLKGPKYWIIPYDQNPKHYFPSPHLLARHLVGNVQHYIGYYSALEIHSLITQPAFREQIVVNKQLKPSTVKIRNHKFQFIYHKPNHFFGAKEVWINNFEKVICSDLEKTFVDCLYKPDYGGGITEIVKALYKSKTRIDFEKLLDYTIKFKAQSVIKRLGFLLELLEIENPILNRLVQLRSKTFILLEPSYEKKGNMNNRWYVRQNIETEEITFPIYS